MVSAEWVRLEPGLALAGFQGLLGLSGSTSESSERWHLDAKPTATLLTAQETSYDSSLSFVFVHLKNASMTVFSEIWLWIFLTGDFG